MATYSSVIKGTIWEDSSAFLMARILGHDGEVIGLSDVTAITYKVVDMADTDTLVASGTLTKGDVIYVSLTDDDRWTVDTTGFNFGATIPASAFPTGARTYRVDIVIDMASGDDIPIVYELTTRKRFTPSA